MPLISFIMTFWLVMCSPVAFATDITVSVDRHPISLDESFQIIFTAPSSPDADPDFSPLEQDFTIISQSQNSSSSWVNGQSRQKIEWIVNVTANDSGNLIIPVIKFGHDASHALPISILPSSANKGVQDDDDLFLDVTATPEKPMIQSQVLYTLKLFRKIDLAKASLSDPELNDAVIEKLGDDANYTTQVSGVTYMVIERKYAIFPQKSGVITIKPLVLTADVISRGRQNPNSFFNSQMTQRRIVKSNAVTLNVQAIPSTFTGHWLAAEHVELTQTWSDDTSQMKVGEPLTRTIKLVANGSTVGQLPELNTAKLDSQLKAYNDQPVLQEMKKSDGLMAIREEKIALIPSKTGDYTLPPIHVAWFNTKTQRMESADLPETVLHATANENGLQTQVTPAQSNQASTVNEFALTPSHSSNESGIWKGIAIFSSIGWLITLGFLAVRWFISRRKVVDVIETPAEISLKMCSKLLKKACLSNDKQAAKEALLHWGKIQFNATSLGAIAPHCEARLRDAILELNTALYSQHHIAWEGKPLFQGFSENAARAKLSTRSEDDVLKPLYRL